VALRPRLLPGLPLSIVAAAKVPLAQRGVKRRCARWPQVASTPVPVATLGRRAASARRRGGSLEQQLQLGADLLS
jgi:hypothetical protein